MPCILVVIALFFPRILMAVLWFFTDWFDGVFSHILWPILGFIFMPFTSLWYSVVVNKYGGEWNALTIIVMVIAVLSDLGSSRSGFKSRRR